MATIDLYSDVNINTPQDVALVTNISSIYQALTTLFNTKKTERLFRPEYGFDLDDILFRIIDSATALYIEQRIVEAIGRWEPRVKLNYAKTTITPYEDENRYDIILAFTVVGFEEQLFEFEGGINI